MKIIPRCFICGGEEFGHRTKEYSYCKTCGHELLEGVGGQTYIVNDPLNEKSARRVDGLDRFKNWLVRKWVDKPNRKCLMDIGSGTGKFLLQQHELFQRVIGLEVTAEVRNFSINVLGLDVREHIGTFEGSITVATFWHSLEHIPVHELQTILDALGKRMENGARVIVSVPNNASFQYRWFREKYAFFDVPNHVHQFSPESLQKLLKRYGFVERDYVFSWPYNVFGYIQALLNVLTCSHNYLYYRLKRHSGRSSFMKDLANVMMLPFAIIIGSVLTPLDLMFPCKQGVMTVCFQKE